MEHPDTQDLASWQPRVDGGVPFAFRIGAVGVGVGAGCGVGLGFGRPIALGSLPFAGQALQGMGAGLHTALGGAGSALQGVGAEARRQVRQLGVPGLDAGFGCGAGLGYGFFAVGLLLKPSVVDSLHERIHGVAGAAAAALDSCLRSAGIGGQADRRAPASSDAGNGGSRSGSSGSDGASAPAVGGVGANMSLAGLPVSSGIQQVLIPSRTQQQQQQQSLADDKEVIRALLRHQRQLDKLRRQNRSLRAALCKLDPSAAACDTKRRGTWDESSDEVVTKS